MTKIKLCGLSRIEDIEAANNLKLYAREKCK